MWYNSANSDVSVFHLSMLAVSSYLVTSLTVWVVVYISRRFILMYKAFYLDYMDVYWNFELDETIDET